MVHCLLLVSCAWVMAEWQFILHEFIYTNSQLQLETTPFTSNYTTLSTALEMGISPLQSTSRQLKG